MELRGRLLGMGTEFEKRIKESLHKTREIVEAQVKEQLKGSGLHFRLEDLSALLEDLSPRASRLLMSYVLNHLRSISHTLGLRVAKLTDNFIEIVLPYQTHNRNMLGEMSEAVLVGAATESCRILWNRRLENESSSLRIQKIEYRLLRPVSSDVRVRVEIEEGQCQTALLDLRAKQEARVKHQIRVCDFQEQLLVELEVDLMISAIPLLGATQNAPQK